MTKVILLLCVMAAALVYAKPSGKQEGAPVATSLDLIDERPNPAANGGTLTLFTTKGCYSYGETFACDGTCFDLTKVHQCLRVVF